MKDDQIRDRLKAVFLSQNNFNYLFDIIYKKIINTNKNYTEIINEYLDSYKANMYQLQEYIFDDHFLEIYKEKNDLEDVLISLNKIIVSRFEYLLLDDLDIKFKLKNNILQEMENISENVNKIEKTNVNKIEKTNVNLNHTENKIENVNEHFEKDSECSDDNYIKEKFIHFLSKDSFKKNKMYNFNVFLEKCKSIDLQKISLKCNMYNINENNNKFYLVEQNTKTLIALPVGYYTISNLLECITKFLNQYSVQKKENINYKVFLNILKNRVCITNNSNNIVKDVKDVFSLYFIENENNFNLANILGFNKLFYGKNCQYIAEDPPNCNIYDNLYLQVYLNNIPINKYETSKRDFSYYEILQLDMDKDFGKTISFESENNQFDILEDLNIKNISFKFNNSFDYNIDDIKFEVIMRFRYN